MLLFEEALLRQEFSDLMRCWRCGSTQWCSWCHRFAPEDVAAVGLWQSNGLRLLQVAGRSGIRF